MAGAVLARVLVARDVAPVEVDEEEGQAAYEDAGRAEVVAGAVAALLVHVSWNKTDAMGFGLKVSKF